MNFWKMVFGLGFGADFVRKAVITKENPFGELTTEQFKEITGEDFIKIETPVEVPTTPPESTTGTENTNTVV